MVNTLARVALVVSLVAASACGPPVNLKEALEVTDVFSGWYDAGIKDAKLHMVPSFTFRLKNRSDRPINTVQLTYDFWFDGADGPFDGGLTRGIGSTSVDPGGTTDPITLRGASGYTLEGAREDFFTHSLYKDATVKIFAKRSGLIAPLGEFKIERRLIPHAPGHP